MEAPVSRKKKLLRDIGIYAVGNLGSKLITFLLVPLYTFYILPDAYGYYDLCLTAVFFIAPIVVCQLNDGGFRFLIEAGDDPAMRTRVVTYVVRTLAVNSAIALAIGGLLIWLAHIAYLPYVVVYIVVMGVYDVTVQMVRGLGKTTMFVGAGVFTAFAVGALSVLFIPVMGMGIAGIFLANTLARAVCLLWVLWRSGLVRDYFKPTVKTGDLGPRILRYSLPLLGVSLCWWMLSSSNKYIIMWALGDAANGLYAVAFKFATILQVLGLIFYQAWQENAIRQYGTPDRNRFFSQVFNNYLYLLSGLVAVTPFAVRWCYPWLIAPEYQGSAGYLYLLVLSCMVYSLSQVVQLAYQCSKHTLRAVAPFLLGTVISIGGSVLTVKCYGIYGVIVANLVAYLVMLAYVLIDTRKYVELSLDRSSSQAIALVVCAGVAFYMIPTWADLPCMLVMCVFFITFAPESFRHAVVAALHRRHG